MKNIFLIFCFSILITSCGKMSPLPLHTYQDKPVNILLNPNSQNTISNFSNVDPKNYADVIRVVDGLDPNYLSSSELEKVTQKYGRSTIDMKSLPYNSPILDSNERPWSAWWYPKYEKTLFENLPAESTLEKYDRYRNHYYQIVGLGRPPNLATSIERSQFNARSLSWEGLCNAWAFVSLLRPEPNKVLLAGIVKFDIADQKALLMKTYEGILDSQIDVYGQKFNGDHDGWIHPDPFPDQFHRFIEEMLINRKKAFIMDHDAGIEIWNVPVYKANYQILPIADRDDAVQVRMWLYSAMPLRKEQMYETGLKETIREYHYVLFGKPLPNGLLEIESGVWIIGPNGTDSRKSHPDYFITIPNRAELNRESFNPAIESKLIDQLFMETEF